MMHKVFAASVLHSREKDEKCEIDNHTYLNFDGECSIDLNDNRCICIQLEEIIDQVEIEISSDVVRNSFKESFFNNGADDDNSLDISIISHENDEGIEKKSKIIVQNLGNISIELLILFRKIEEQRRTKENFYYWL